MEKEYIDMLPPDMAEVVRARRGEGIFVSEALGAYFERKMEGEEAMPADISLTAMYIPDTSNTSTLADIERRERKLQYLVGAEEVPMQSKQYMNRLAKIGVDPAAYERDQHSVEEHHETAEDIERIKGLYKLGNKRKRRNIEGELGMSEANKRFNRKIRDFYKPG